MSEYVKLYRVSGFMKIKNTWQKFTIELTATKVSEAIERVYSWLGSRHKLPRSSIRITEVRVISPEEAKRREVVQLLALDKVVKFY